jgi:hypothetical protein
VAPNRFRSLLDTLPLGCVFDTINGRMLRKNLNPLKHGGSH